MAHESFAAVVLAGGRAARLGGFDKASIEIDGRTLLTHALDAVVDASEVVVTSEWSGASGIGGFFERTFAPRGLDRIYGELLDNLADAVAR